MKETLFDLIVKGYSCTAVDQDKLELEFRVKFCEISNSDIPSSEKLDQFAALNVSEPLPMNRHRSLTDVPVLAALRVCAGSQASG